MLIDIHAIQNHSPANLNRDDLGAPKTCYFGGALRSRISSQCIKRSIRTSAGFKELCGGIRTRQLAKLIAEQVQGKPEVRKRADKILALCGFKAKAAKKAADGDSGDDGETSKMLVYTTRKAIEEMAGLLTNGGDDKELAQRFAMLIAERSAVPDMALSGRMLEPGKSDVDVWKKLDTTVEAALQVAHAISTHEARPEIDYYVAADDIPGDNAGAGFVDEAMFASACFYKYFSIHWETLLANLGGYDGNKEHLAAHTVGAFLRAAATTTPSGKQNSFAAHNPPDGMLVEIKDAPVSYANAFADPVPGMAQRGIVAQSVAQLAQYAHDLDTGYGKPHRRFWFSPNLRFPFAAIDGGAEIALADSSVKSLDALIADTIGAIGYDWQEVQKTVVDREVPA